MTSLLSARDPPGKGAFPKIRPVVGALAALPAALTLYLSFASGGFFPDATGFAVVLLSLVLVVRVTLAERPFAGVSGPVLVAGGALILLATWTLLSGIWSGSPARALLEFDRTLLYLLALVTLATLPVTGPRLEWALRAFAGAVTVVCLAGLVSRLLPDVLATEPSALVERLSYPVSYWNALGLLAAVAVIVCLHLTSGPGQPRAVRALGAGAIPLLAATLLLTFSRGAIVVAVLGAFTYLVLGRPRGLLATALAVGPTTALALAAAYGAELLSSETPTAPAAIAQGHELAPVLLGCALAAGLIRLALTPVDDLLERRSERLAAARSAVTRGTRLAGVAAMAAVALVTLLLALDLPDRMERQYTRFVEGDSLATAATRDRLTSLANNGRLDHWGVAVDAFGAAPLRGQGAGTYQIIWSRDRDSGFNVLDGHSLYLESLAELGVVGLALLAVALLTLVGALVVRARGRNRSLYAAVLAAVLAWAVHAGVDWHWEMPAVTAWVFALGGLGIAAPGGGPDRASGPAPLTRILAALGCLLLAVTPALAALSQQALDESVAAFRRGDCTRSVDAALASISYLSVRPQPFELLAYCDVRVGLSQLAVKIMRKALARDPANWEYHYGLALVRGAAGVDPRPQAATALALNPLSPLTREAAIELGTADRPREWRRRALQARLPLAP